MSRNNEPIGFSWSYRDFLWTLIAAFMVLAIIAISSLNLNHNKSVYLGDLIIQTHWDPKSASDIDLWVQSPKLATEFAHGIEDDPVGYARQNGINCNLLRDDLGWDSYTGVGDSESNNSETTVCRHAYSGLYIIDVMSYDIYDARVPVWVDVSVKKWNGSGYDEILSKRVSLENNKEVLTVWQFHLGQKGNLIQSSINNHFVDLFARQMYHSNSPPSANSQIENPYEGDEH